MIALLFSDFIKSEKVLEFCEHVKEMQRQWTKALLQTTMSILTILMYIMLAKVEYVL